MAQTKQQLTDKVINVIATTTHLDPSDITPTEHLRDDIGLDSLDVVEIVMNVEKEFSINIPDADAEKLVTVNGIVEYLHKLGV